MNNPICRKVISMLGAYIENKLNDDGRLFVESHFAACKSCRKKFYEMSEIMNNLQFEYEKMLKEFNKIEANRTFDIKEYESFYNNISPYVDDELCYEDSLKFRKYLLKSKPAREELSNIYELRSHIKKSALDLMDKSNINFSKKIIKKLKEVDNPYLTNIYKKAVITIFSIIGLVTICLVFVGISYFNKSYADIQTGNGAKIIVFPDDSDWVAFFFDDSGTALLSAK